MIKTVDEAVNVLRHDWTGETGGPIRTVELLIANDGYFEVPHLLMTYVDYLSGLHSGKGPDRKTKFMGIRDFFNAYFGEAYKRAGAWLIFQFRHGLVHAFAPNVIRLESGVEVGWCCDLGQQGLANHLRLLPRADNKHFNLWVNGVQFLIDFKDAVRRFADDVESNPAAFERFMAGQAAYEQAINIKGIKEHVRYVTEADKQWLRDNAQSAREGT